jgi:GMP synthase-like glutamine amidotransferase
VHVLALIHGQRVRSGTFGDVVAHRGHELEEWSLAWGTPPPRPLDDYGAVLVFGGAMHADQDDHHPWLREENLFLQRALDLHLPMLGVCLGAQLIAKAAHAPVGPAPEPEIGWFDVELTPAATDDPLFSRLPERFEAFQWHYYTYGLPGGAVELARSEICTQGYRLGDLVWGIQFHAEVTAGQVEGWLREDEPVAIDRERIATATQRRIAGWNDLGGSLCSSFLDVAERVAVAA